MNKLEKRINAMFDKLSFIPKPLLGIALILLSALAIYLVNLLTDQNPSFTVAVICLPFIALPLLAGLWNIVNSKTLHRLLILMVSCMFPAWFLMFLYALFG